MNNKKNIISIFPGSRTSEIKHHMPILINFIKWDLILSIENCFFDLESWLLELGPAS